jgi:uncharacterized protein (TIGR02147 family)
VFLAEFYQEKKRANSSWSYGVWARQLELKSSSTLIMILKGQRNPSRALTKDLCRYFNFDKTEAQYFSDLVTLAKARNDVQLSLQVLKKLETRHPDRGFHLLNQDSFQTISNWYHYAIREMTRLPGFLEDPKWIAERLQFPVSEERISEAIQNLLRLGLIQRRSSGRLEATAVHLDTKADIADEGLKRHHEQHLENAKKAIRRLTPAEREISGGCFAIRAENLSRAKELIRSFQIQLCNELEVTDGDSVFQIEVAFFPLTKQLKEQI